MIHQYKLGGYNIVLDVCSGSVHAVDEVAYDIIAMFEDNDRETVIAAMAQKYAGRDDITPADIEECYDQVVELRDAGKLFAPDTFEPMAGKLKEKTAGVVKALCLHIAHTCNLRSEEHTSELQSQLVIFARAQRTAVAASARLPASPLARPAAASLTSSARTRASKEMKMPPQKGGIF